MNDSEKQPQSQPRFVIEEWSPEKSEALSSRTVLIKFIGGILTGVAITGFFMIAVRYADGRWLGRFIVASTISKFVLSAVLLRRPRWNPVGSGVLFSIALVALMIGFDLILIAVACGQHGVGYRDLH